MDATQGTVRCKFKQMNLFVVARKNRNHSKQDAKGMDFSPFPPYNQFGNQCKNLYGLSESVKLYQP